MRIKLLVVHIFLLFFSSLKAQYYQYSQYNYATQRVNPSSISLDDQATTSVIYRSQNVTSDLKLKSFLLSVKYPLIAKNGGKRWSSIGVTVGQDKTGQGGILVANELGLTYAINPSIGKNQSLSIGAKANYQMRKIDISNLHTGNQYVPGIGFIDGDIDEILNAFNTTFLSYSAGVYWQKTSRRSEKLAHFGLSLFDLNKPNESLLGDNSLLPSTWVLTGGVKVYEQQQIKVYPEALYTYSSLTNTLSIGAVTQYSLKGSNAKLFANRIDFHTKYLLNEGVMLGIQFLGNGYSYGVSYDIPINSRTAHRGAFEIAAELSKLVESRFKQKRNKRRKISSKKRRRTYKNKKSKHRKNKRRKSTDKKKKEQVPVKKLLANNNEGKEIIVEEIVNEDTTALKETSTDGIATIGKIKHEPLPIEESKLVYNFGFDSSALDKEMKSYIQGIIAILHKDKYIKIKIVGHTDNIGTEQYNVGLSNKRANIIRDQLIANNIDNERIICEGKGEKQPLNDNSTSHKRLLNRRVEIFFYY
ncbi:MAG: PorP/SprF family type IX secretion system membrane protein [Cyclobacteriaceae bacterium]|nr:PorP/SprF family type IX secretion system membrane protein [Cyclobacteriaceae bacterium]